MTRILAAVAVLVAVAGLGVGPAAAEGERAGTAVIVGDDGRPLDHGASSTPFTFRLPTGAACPGDSANDDVRLQSFIVPDGVDPAGLTYESTKPAGEGNWALYEVTSDPFVQGLTAMAVDPGDPGVIDQLPVLDFAVFPPGTLAEGVNHVGIACTRFNETIRYWDTDLVLTDDPTDTPAQLTWVAPDATAGTSSSSHTVLWVGLGAVGLGAIGGAFGLIRRRPSPALDKETSR